MRQRRAPRSGLMPSQPHDTPRLYLLRPLHSHYTSQLRCQIRKPETPMFASKDLWLSPTFYGTVLAGSLFQDKLEKTCETFLRRLSRWLTSAWRCSLERPSFLSPTRTWGLLVYWSYIVQRPYILAATKRVGFVNPRYLRPPRVIRYTSGRVIKVFSSQPMVFGM